MRQRLEIPPGINTDDTAFRYPGTWRDCDQVRFWKGAPEVIGGWESVTNDLLTGVCRTVHMWVDNDAMTNIAFGQHDQLTICQDANLFDVTPTSGFTPGAIDGTGGAGYGTGSYGTGDYSEPSISDYYALTWSLDNWGESLMANPRNQTIFWWQNNTANKAAILTNAPTNVTYMLVAYTRQVMAFGCNEESSGSYNPMCIRFSDIEDPTDWTTASDNNAGEVILEGGGQIVGAKSIGEYIFVWTNSSLFQGVFTGDNTNPWVFTKIGSNCGLSGPNAVAVVAQTAYWFSSQKRFMYCQVGGVPTILTVMVGDSMAENLAPAQNDKIVATSISKFNEVWWFYPDGRDGIENSRYVAVSLSDGATHTGTVARTAFCDMSVGTNLYPVGVSYAGNIYYHEKGATADGDARMWFLETSDFYIDEEERCMMVKCMWPDFQRQTGSITMVLRGLQYPQSTPEVFANQTVTFNTGKIDFRFSGRLIRVRLSGNTAPSDMRLGVPVFDVAPAGDR